MRFYVFVAAVVVPFLATIFVFVEHRPAQKLSVLAAGASAWFQAAEPVISPRFSASLAARFRMARVILARSRRFSIAVFRRTFLPRSFRLVDIRLL